MAGAARLNVRRGIATVLTAVMASTVVAMYALLSKLLLKVSLNFSRGKFRKADATRKSGARLGSDFSARALAALPRCSSSSSTARFSLLTSCPAERERLGIGTLHLSPQFRQGTEL